MHTHIHIYNVYISVCMYMYVCMYVCMFGCMILYKPIQCVAGAAHPYFETIYLNMKLLRDPLHRPALRDDEQVVYGFIE